MMVAQGCPTIEPLLFVECIFSFSQCFFPAIVSTGFGNSRAIKDASIHPRNQGGSPRCWKLIQFALDWAQHFSPRCNKTSIMFLEFSRREGSSRASKSMARGHV